MLLGVKNASKYFLDCKVLSIERRCRGCNRGTVFQEVRPGDGFHTSGFVKKKLGGGGGGTSERLPCFLLNRGPVLCCGESQLLLDFPSDN